MLFIDPSLVSPSHRATPGCLFRSHGSRHRQNGPPSSETSLAASRTNRGLLSSQLMSCRRSRKIWFGFHNHTNTGQRQHNGVLLLLPRLLSQLLVSLLDKELLFANLGVSRIASTCVSTSRAS